MKKSMSFKKFIFQFHPAIYKFIRKFLHDFVLIFYDDLEFKAMSLPRTIIGILTSIYIANWIFSQFYGKQYILDSFSMVYATVWGAYSVKAWRRREHHGQSADSEGTGGVEDESQTHIDEP